GSGDCAEGRMCTAATVLPFVPGNYCVARPGVWSCPSTYPTSHVYYHGATDTRGCSDCACEAPVDATCGAGARATYAQPDAPGGGATYDHPDCTGGEKKWTTPTSCTALGSEYGTSKPVEPRGGRCVAKGGAPIGALTPTTATTVCCVK